MSEKDMDIALVQMMFERVGAIKAMDAVGKFVDAGKYGLYKQIKDSKVYKHYDGMDWERFCKEILGRDKKTIDAEIKLFEELGEDFMRAMGRIHLTKRDLLVLDKNLPEDIKAEIRKGIITIAEKKFNIAEIKDREDEFIEAVELLNKQRESAEKEKRLIEKELKHHQRKEVEFEQKINDLSKEVSALKPPETAENRKTQFIEQINLVYDHLAACSGLLHHKMDFSLALNDRDLAVKYRAVCKMVIAIAHNLEDKIGEVD